MFSFCSSLLGVFFNFPSSINLPFSLSANLHNFSMFPTDVPPLIPALQSDWLAIHVTTTALGSAILACSFIAGLIYLLRYVDQTKSSKGTFWLEVVMYTIVATLAFIVITSVFRGIEYEAVYKWVDRLH